MTGDDRAPGVCPVCGADVPAGARACPECGADENTGWNEDSALYDGLDLPDNEFDYDEFAQREFGRNSPSSGGLRRYRLAGVLALVALILALLLRFVL